MRTEQLIDLLSADAPAGPPLQQRMLRALAAAVAASALLLVATIGLRPDILAALETPRVLFKIVFTLLLAASACSVAFRIGLPGLWVADRARLLLLPALLLAAGILAELAALPEASWLPHLRGEHAAFCVFFIPVLAVAPLAALLGTLRFGAPESPEQAGAAAGLAAGSLAAALYAWHCPDDSPLFLVTWYGIAIGLVTALGWAIGRRLLRW